MVIVAVPIVVIVATIEHVRRTASNSSRSGRFTTATFFFSSREQIKAVVAAVLLVNKHYFLNFIFIGNKVLRKALIGPKIAAYYPPSK